MRRLSDILGERIAEAIRGLDELLTVRQSVCWEVAPALIPQGGGMALAYMVALSVPVPGSLEEDHVLYMAPLDDPHASQERVSELVTSLYGKCQAEADEIRRKVRAQANGHGTTPGGLIVP